MLLLSMKARGRTSAVLGEHLREENRFHCAFHVAMRVMQFPRLNQQYFFLCSFCPLFELFIRHLRPSSSSSSSSSQVHSAGVDKILRVQL